MIRQTEGEMRNIAAQHDNCKIVLVRLKNKWAINLVIENYATIRMRSDRLSTRPFASVETALKYCQGMADKYELDIGE